MDVLEQLDNGVDAALIRVLGVVEVLNEILGMRKSLPEEFAEVLQKMREALEEDRPRVRGRLIPADDQ